jgi:gamma-butyrobetaine dioxygenase
MHAIEVIADLFENEGSREYFGEAVTMSAHMLQAGALAQAAGAPRHLVAAALLHDVGHLRTVSSDVHRHEEVGARWLSTWLPAEVTEPVRLHVAAKRYLCATDLTYLATLSPASVESLRVQGGPMSAEEVREFERNPYAAGAIAVRRWDEAAKDPAAVTPSFDHFRGLLERLLTPTSSVYRLS